MNIHKDLSEVLAAHPFLEGLSPAQVEVVTGCASNVRFDGGAYLFREGEEADQCYLLRAGRVAIELRADHHPTVVKTLGPGELLGWSWLVPPHIWRVDARAVELTRAIALDGACLRRKCEADPALGYALLKRLAQDLEDRMFKAWMQMVDVYGPPAQR